MGKLKEFNEEYEKQLQSIPLPTDLKDVIKIEACLKMGGLTGTALARSLVLNQKFVLKWGTGAYAGLLEQEYNILTDLTSKGFTGIPCPYKFFTEQDTAYLLREYIPGKSLYEIIENSAPLSEKEIRFLGRQLCRMLHQFQSMNPPLIHRDIKPENLIRGNDGQLYLIDFDSARYYQPGGRKDTFLIGSLDTAAPEQYGITQTDFRTDMYAAGKTLCFAACGGYEGGMLQNVPISRKLKKVILKAMEFDPDKRYRSAQELEKALGTDRTLGDLRKSPGIILAAAALLLAVGMKAGMILERSTENPYIKAEGDGAIMADEGSSPAADTGIPEFVDSGKFSDFEEETNDDNEVIFREKLIEQAVRQQLGLDEAAPVTEKMLLDITSLSIAENQILTEENNVYNRGAEVATGNRLFLPEERGEIRDLTDLTHMKHLLKLTLCNQHITDLTPLQNLPIEQLYLPNNDITDISAVKTLFNLTELSISGNPVENMSELKECGGLTFLNISSCSLPGLDFLKEMKVSELSLAYTQVEEGLEILRELGGITDLHLGNLDEELAEILQDMEALTAIHCWDEYRLPDLAALKEIKKLTSLAGNGFTTLEGIGELPALEELYIDRSQVHDLSPIPDAQGLKIISILDMTVFDLKPLLEHPGLERVICTESQKKKILELNPNPPFLLGW